jgi:putative nucleotidyltransferase with HDIG domain
MTYIKLPDGDNPMQLPQVQKVVAAARAGSQNAYLVGGFLRDILWKGAKGAEAKDLDFAISGGKALDFAKKFAGEHNAHFVILDESFDTARVVFDDGTYLDFAGCVGGSIESDLRRRDFTVNALAFDASKPDCVLDLFDALGDIENGLIRAISKDVLADDPLRLLRAFRFKATLNAQIETQTMQWIKELSGLIEGIACERINAEMFILLNAKRSGQIVCELGQTGLLESIYPELRETRRVTPNDYHHLNLFDHSIETVHQLEENLGRLPEWVHESARETLSFGVTRLAAAKLAALLHDIGKPGTWEINEEGRHTFYGHDSKGADMADLMAERMKWSKPVGRFISKLIQWHLRPGALFHHGLPTEKAVMRFYRKMGVDLPELIALALGDLGATCGDGLPEQSRLTLADQMIDLLYGYRKFVEESKEKPRFLNGLDVMRLLDIAPGPLIGEILEALAEAQSLKEVQDRPSAERFVIEYKTKK